MVAARMLLSATVMLMLVEITLSGKELFVTGVIIKLYIFFQCCDQNLM